MTPQEGLTFLAAEIGRRRNEPAWVAGLNEAAARKLLEIARLLDGHALALLQAGNMAGGMGLEHALAQARANPALGETERRFDFSYRPLPQTQQELLHRLAAFGAGFDLGAVQRILTTEGEGVQPLPHWDADLPELVRGSFVERQVLGPDYTRFRLHPVMREYLRHKAGEDAMAAHDRHTARYFLALADWGWRQLGNPETALQAVTMAALERANLLAAQEVALAQELWEERVSLAYRLNELFTRSGHWGDRRRALEAGVEAARQAGDENTAAELSHNLGAVYQDIGEYAEARARYQQALEVKRQLDDQKGVATELHQLGMLAQATGDYDEARSLYQESLEIKQQLGDRAQVATTLAQLALLEEAEGNVPRALELIRQAEGIFTELGSPYAAQARSVRERLQQ